MRLKKNFSRNRCLKIVKRKVKLKILFIKIVIFSKQSNLFSLWVIEVNIDDSKKFITIFKNNFPNIFVLQKETFFWHLSSTLTSDANLKRLTLNISIHFEYLKHEKIFLKKNTFFILQVSKSYNFFLKGLIEFFVLKTKRPEIFANSNFFKNCFVPYSVTSKNYRETKWRRTNETADSLKIL